MSDRTMVVLYGEHNDEICNLYVMEDTTQNIGLKLARYLDGLKMTSGTFGPGYEKPYANGPDCLAAQIVVLLKQHGPGGTYLHVAGARNYDENYAFHIHPQRAPGEVYMIATRIGVHERGHRVEQQLFEGYPDQMINLLTNWNQNEEEQDA